MGAWHIIKYYGQMYHYFLIMLNLCWSVIIVIANWYAVAGLGGYGLIVDNLRSQGQNLWVTEIPMVTVHQLFYISPFICQWLLSITINWFNCDSNKQICMNLLTEEVVVSTLLS